MDSFELVDVSGEPPAFPAPGVSGEPPAFPTSSVSGELSAFPGPDLPRGAAKITTATSSTNTSSATVSKPKTPRKRNAMKKPAKTKKPAKARKPKACRKKKPQHEFRWKREAFQKAVHNPEQDQFFLTEDVEPIECFEKFFTEDLLQMIVEQSNLYSSQISDDGVEAGLSIEDIRDFIAVELLMGIVRIPSYRDYWSNEFRYEQVASKMSRNHYEKIRKYLHFADNSQEQQNDRFFKIRLLSEYLRKQFLEVPEEKKMSVDEMMIKYKGKKAGSRKQYMKKKPTKWGFKMFVRSGLSGFVYDFLLYSGADMLDHISFTRPEESLTYSSQVVAALVKTMKTPTLSCVYFDNWFSSPELVRLLREEYGMLSIGTLRGDRSSGATSELHDDKHLKREGRGSYDEVSDNQNNVTIVKWFDNRSVLLTSSYVGSKPVTVVKRWSGSERKFIDVPCPKIVLEYNSFMGRVDKGGMLVSFHKTPLKTFKWYMSIFSQLLDISINNVWLLYKREMEDSKMTLKIFRKTVAQSLLKMGRNSPPSSKGKRGRPKTSPPENRNPPPVPVPCRAVRNDGVGHLPDFKAKGRCRVCQQTTFVVCTKCDIRLCFVRDRNCFLLFHQS